MALLCPFDETWYFGFKIDKLLMLNSGSGATIISMNNEIGIRNSLSILNVCQNKTDLLLEHNSTSDSSKGVKYRDIIKDINFDAKWGKILGIPSIVPLAGCAIYSFSPEFAALSPLVAMSAIILPPLVSMSVAALGCTFGAKFYDSHRLKRCMKSKNPKKRAYYVNRILDSMIVDYPESPLFNNPYTLGYALWFHEKTRMFRSQKNMKAYNISFKLLRIEDFKADGNSVLYLRMAGDMISGLLEKEAIPRIAQTESHRLMFEKYSVIIKSRPVDKGYLLSYREILTEKEFAKQAKELVAKDKSEANDRLSAKHQEEFSQWEYNAETSLGLDAGLHDYDDDLKTMHAIESEWFNTQSDIVQILKYPMLSDMSEPLVRDFHTQMSIAQSLTKKTLNHSFVVAVSNMKTAWSSLIYEAHRVELSKFDEGERKKILMATNLMNIALNTASTASERQSAYKKAMEQLKGLVVLPESVRMMLDQSVSRNELVA